MVENFELQDTNTYKNKNGGDGYSKFLNLCQNTL